MNFNRIRIDKDSLIQVPTRTEGLGSGTLYLYFTNDLAERPTEVAGEMAEALRGWITGEKVYPVTENGILNIYGNIVEGLTAQRALGTVDFPLVEVGTMFNDAQDGPYMSNIQTIKPQELRIPSAVPQIDVNKIAKAIKDRKD